MTFQPVLPFSGYAGWRFLQRTLAGQQETYANSAPQKRATDYFREKIGTVQTADALVGDRRLLEVALTAFGLQDDINNKAFLRKILDDGTLDPDALGNRLTDKRYLAFSKAFGFGDYSVPRTVLSTFPNEILGRYNDQAFETAVGAQDDSLRLALNFESGLTDVLKSSKSQNAQWYSMMGNPPLREVFQTAFGFPSSFSQMDVDRQLEEFKDRSDSFFGTTNLADFTDPEKQEKLVRTYMIRSEAAAFAATPAGSVALSLLQNASNFYRR